MGAVRSGRDRESVNHSDGVGSNIFDQQPGEYPLCDVELELGADAGGQSEGAFWRVRWPQWMLSRRGRL